MIDVNLKSTMISFSNRITKTDEEGNARSFYRLQVRVQNDNNVVFFINDDDGNAPAYIPFLASKQFGELFLLTVTMNYSSKAKKWYVNVKNAEAIK